MTDSLEATPDLARLYCPGCEPETFLSSEITKVAWCVVHQPGGAGIDDSLATAAERYSTSEGDGETCRHFAQWQASLRR